MEQIKNALHIGKHAGEGGVNADGTTTNTGSSLTSGVNVDNQNIGTAQRDPGFVRDTLHVGKHAGEGGVPPGGSSNTTTDTPLTAGVNVDSQNIGTAHREPGFVRDTLHVGKHAGEGGVAPGTHTTTDSTSTGSAVAGGAAAGAAAGGAYGASQATEEPPKEHGILRQILNPGNDKYDPALFQGSESDVLAAPVSANEPIPGALRQGDAAKPIASTDAAEDNHGILRQLINPGGEKYDEMRYEPTGNVVTDSSAAASTGTTAVPSSDPGSFGKPAPGASHFAAAAVADGTTARE